MKYLLLIPLLMVLSACTTYRVTAIENGRHVLVPTIRDFQIKTGGKKQVGVDEYLVIGKMSIDNNIYSVIQLPYDISGIIIYCLVSENGEMYSKMVSAVNKNVEPVKSEFVVVPIHQAKVIPDTVRFLPN